MALFDGLFGSGSDGSNPAVGAGSSSFGDLLSDPTMLVALQMLANGSQKRLLTDPRGQFDGVIPLLLAATKQKNEMDTKKKLASLNPEADAAKLLGQAGTPAPGSAPSGQRVGGLGGLGGFPLSNFDAPANGVGETGVASAMPSMAGQPMPNVGGGADDLTTALIKQKEGFLSEPKWDRTALRAGFGSDTTTLADGTVVPIGKGMTVSKEDAERDLKRRIGEFQGGVRQTVGDDAWNALPDQAKAAVTSVAYNYGSIDKLPSLVNAIKAGDTGKIADAIESYAGHNDGINAKRRQDEAALVRSALNGGDQQMPQVRGNQVASIDPTFMPSPATPNKALDDRMRPGLGLSRLPDAAVMPADQARALPPGALSGDQSVSTPGIQPNAAPSSPAMTLAQAMSAKPPAGAPAGFSTDQAPSVAPAPVAAPQAPPATGNTGLDQMRKEAAAKAAAYGKAINAYSAAGKPVPETYKLNYENAMKILQPTEIEKALAAIPDLTPQERNKAMRKQAGIGPTEFDEKLDKAFPDPTDPRRQAAAQVALQMGPLEAGKKLDELVQRGIIKKGDADYSDNAKELYGIKKEKDPNSVQEAEWLLKATPEQRKAYMDNKAAGRPVNNTTVNNAVNPLISGGGKEADDIITSGREAANGIYTLHEARSQLDKPGGIISGFGADYLKNGQRIAAFFGADPSKVVNTESYVATVGQAVLNQAKALGANPSNEDARRINQILGGTTELNEKTMRNILDFQENLLRRKVKTANDVIDQYAETYGDNPDILKAVKARRIKEPGAYEKPKAEGAVALPDGYTADRAVSEAKAAIAAGKDPQAVMKRLQSLGIDPSQVK
jgi:GH24 family phage-related lysozyme (muramidase)